MDYIIGYFRSTPLNPSAFGVALNSSVKSKPRLTANKINFPVNDLLLFF